MSAAWTIKRAHDEEVTFEDASIKNVTRRLVNQGPDTAQVSFGRGNIFTPEPWDTDETVRILRDGVIWFRGRNLGGLPSATGASEGFSMTLAGPWWQLEHLVYTQPAPFVSSDLVDAQPTSTAILDFDTVWKNSSTIFVAEDQLGNKVDTRAMILDVLAFAIAHAVPLQVGTIDAGVQIAREELRAITCGDLIKRCLRWTPSQASWFDYTTTPPTLHIRKRVNRTLVTFDIGDEQTEEVSIAARRDLLLSGVRIEYMRTHQRDTFEFRTMDVDQAGPNPTGVGALIVPVELYGSYLNNGVVITAEPVPVGVAAAVYEAYDSVPFAGRIKIVRDEVSDERWTALTAAVTGGNPLWASMRADIQEATDDIATGRTEITLGPPQHLGPVDVVNLARSHQSRVPSLPDRLTHAGGGSPLTNPVPVTSTDERLPFLRGGGQTPDVILHMRFYFDDLAFGVPLGSDRVDFHGPDGTITSSATAFNVTGGIGSITIMNNVRVGRGSNKNDVPSVAYALAHGTSGLDEIWDVYLNADGGVSSISHHLSPLVG